MQKEENAKVSVLLPVYKPKEEYLRACIESILEQTYKNFELLILDDCPEDKTAEAIIKSYSDSRIKYERNEQNLGISATRNKLIEKSTGKYLAVMDHDDISLPERLSQEVSYLEEHPEVGVISGKLLKIPSQKISSNPSENHEIKLSLMTMCAVSHPASMIRKSVLEKTKIRYEEEFSPAEDYALWCRLIPHTQFHNLSEVILKYRWHESNTSITQKSQMRNATKAIQSFVKIDNPKLYEEFTRTVKEQKRLNIFGIIPLLKIIKKDNKMSVYLFEKIKLFDIKTTIKLQEK